MKQTIFSATAIVLMLALAFSFKGKSVRTVVTHTDATFTQSDVTSDALVSMNYGNLPLSFEANQGQTDGKINFIARGSGYSLFLKSNEAVLSLSSLMPDEMTLDSFSELSMGSPINLTLMSKFWPREELARDYNVKPKEHKTTKLTTVRLKLVGANVQPLMVGLDELPGKSNYFIGNDPIKWRTNIPTYTKVKYEEVYPGIDLIYYGNQRQLEYDFVVTPGFNPKDITIEFDGTNKIEIDDNGDLVLHTDGGEIRQHKPLVYQEVNDVMQEIVSCYTLKDNNRVGFQVNTYDNSTNLVIDPVLIYSTYLGGSANDDGRGIALDATGNVYVTGFTSSTNFPTANSVQLGYNGGSSDVFVTKLNSAGSAIIYSTYLGGSHINPELGNGIAVGASGNAYVTGQTSSPDFPTMNPLQPTLSGTAGAPTDAFVTKLNPTGSELVYSTFFGGEFFDSGEAIDVDASGNAYVAGRTYQAFPATPGAFQTTHGGLSDDSLMLSLLS